MPCVFGMRHPLWMDKHHNDALLITAQRSSVPFSCFSLASWLLLVCSGPLPDQRATSLASTTQSHYRVQFYVYMCHTTPTTIVICIFTAPQRSAIFAPRPPRRPSRRLRIWSSSRESVGASCTCSRILRAKSCRPSCYRPRQTLYPLRLMYE